MRELEDYQLTHPKVSNQSLFCKEQKRRTRSSTVFITSKAAIFSLIWSVGVNTFFQFTYQPTNFISIIFGFNETSNTATTAYVFYSFFYMFYPLAGFLADTKFGRYRMVIRSLKFLVFVSIFQFPVIVIITTLNLIFQSSSTILSSCSIALFTLMLAIGIPGLITFNANIIQFGMDQLLDSPAHHQGLFIHWYVCIHSFSLLVTQLPVTLRFEYFLIPSLLLFFILILSLVLLLVALVFAVRNKCWFVIDTARLNPYKLVYKVTKFATQHKVPLRRSAFTYCEDELPHGLDLGKTKYGGPFTTEEVEDVKAFYGILKVLFSLGPIFFLYLSSNIALQQYDQNYLVSYNDSEILYLYNKAHYSNKSHSDLHKKVTFLLQSDVITYFSITTFLLVYIFVLRWNCHRYIPSMTKRIGIGIVFLLLSLISGFIVLTIIHNNHRNTYCCIFGFFSSPYFKDIFLTLIPRFFLAISITFTNVAMYEVICSQSPQSMKGFLIGLLFAIKGIFQLLATFSTFPFYIITSTFPSCGMYYYMMTISVGFLALVTYVYVAKKFSHRKRDEICEIYQYAEEYYSKGP